MADEDRDLVANGKDVVGLKCPQNLKKELENRFQRSIPGNKTQHSPTKPTRRETDVRKKWMKSAKAKGH